jgi:gas vesicle structural protein
VDPANPQRAQRRARPGANRPSAVSQYRHVSLCETLDRVLNKGAVIAGDIVISVADVDLLYLGLNLVVTSVETMRNWNAARPDPSQRTEP